MGRKTPGGLPQNFHASWVRPSGGLGPRPDRARHGHRTRAQNVAPDHLYLLRLFSKSAYTIVPHSETQSYFTPPRSGEKLGVSFLRAEFLLVHREGYL